MAETLLSLSEVLLYGRIMDDIQFKYTPPPSTVEKGEYGTAPPPRPGKKFGGNSLLQDQFAVDDGSPAAPCFARIYGFSYEGGYYDLDAPIIMLVHGMGVSAESVAGDPRASRAPDTADKSGAAAQTHSFADDIKVWSYDKADFSVRLDSLTGSIEDILLDIEIGSGAGPVSGGKVSGGKVSGGKVAGGKVAGGKVAGGKVAGGKVSGGKVSGPGD